MKLFKIIGRVLICLVSLFFLGWFVLPIFSGLLRPNIGNVFGVFLCLCLLFRFGFTKCYNSLKEQFYRKKLAKILWKCMTIVASAFVIYAVVAGGAIIYCASQPAPKNATVVVLGAQVKPWGPSVNLQQRIDAAVAYMKENPECKAVVSGGKGDDEPISEAQSIFEDMLRQGISKERIYMEDKSANTKQNLKFSHRIINKYNLNNNLAIATDSFHQLRARLIAKKEFPNSQIGAINAVNGRIGLLCYPTFFVREWIAIPYEVLRNLF